MVLGSQIRTGHAVSLYIFIIIIKVLGNEILGGPFAYEILGGPFAYAFVSMLSGILQLYLSLL